MFDRYVDNEQRKLEQLGERYQEQQRLLERQRQRLQSLQALDAELAVPVSGNALTLRNRIGLRGQLGTLIQFQQHETELADLSMRDSLASLRTQLGRVKGLEHVQGRRAQAVRELDARREQRGLDDWVNRAVGQFD